jgi:hypothetical protein
MGLPAKAAFWHLLREQDLVLDRSDSYTDHEVPHKFCGRSNVIDGSLPLPRPTMRGDDWVSG